MGKGAAVEEGAGFGVGAAPRCIRLELLNRFALSIDGREFDIAPGSQRVLALLGARNREISRETAYALLWPGRSESRAAGNLRSAIYRLPDEARGAIVTSKVGIGLHPDVDCDVASFFALSQRLRHPASDGFQPSDLSVRDLLVELLPTWYDDWVLLERARVQQERILALQALAGRLAACGRYGEALEAGLAAVAADALHEQAHLCVMRTHLAEGNPSEAVRQFEILRDLLHDNLGIGPSAEVIELVGSIRTAGREDSLVLADHVTVR
jgi:DNA-binding SARP family transcriptional activator